jgi:very-short-patch-repair endonuclease
LRKFLTPEEAKLWIVLRSWKREGTRFRRQVVIGNYIVDFACHRSMIIIELDGSQHAEDKHQREDIYRDQELEAMGYEIVRIWNESFNREYDETLQYIWRCIEPRLPSPSP